jgi:hypothetical protein
MPPQKPGRSAHGPRLLRHAPHPGSCRAGPTRTV